MREINPIIERMKSATSCKTNTELAIYLGLKSSGAISTWKTRGRVPYPECEKISQSENIDIGYLLTGKQVGESIFPKALQGKAVTAHSDTVQISQYDVTLSAGMGACPSEHALSIGARPFDKQWLVKKSLDIIQLSLVRIIGDSMEPLLKDKDIVMIDASRTKPSEGMPYAIRLDGDLLVKSIQRTGDGLWSLVSRNKAYDNIMINPEKPPTDFAILGAVVWHAHSWI
ncbi:phage repressor [Abyssogena phaseoliformis symbiont OG214]|nr:phage repressor [Abyssogena phaseoliformis symbiont OG214]